MKIITQKYITRKDIQKNRDKIYLFGDNLLHRGSGGQAKEMRGEPNSIGIPTKKFPSMYSNSFLSDEDFELAKDEIDKAFNMIPSSSIVIIPEDGLGTGLAKLDIKAPRIFNYIGFKINSLKGKI